MLYGALAFEENLILCLVQPPNRTHTHTHTRARARARARALYRKPWGPNNRRSHDISEDEKRTAKAQL